jgi:hypothetical protein
VPGFLGPCFAQLRDDVELGAQETSSTDYVFVSQPLSVLAAHSGMTGRARIFGKKRSLAYSELYLPMARLFGVHVWSMLL